MGKVIDQNRLAELMAKREAQQNEAAETRMMDILRQKIAGMDPKTGWVLDAATHNDSVRLWEELKRNKDDREDRAARLQLEGQRLQIAAMADHERVQIEIERLQIEKAKVVVHLLETAVQGGLSGEQLLSTVLGLSDRLLPGAAPLAPGEAEKAPLRLLQRDPK